MTVKELITQLEGFDEETEVRFSYDYGDRCHTPVAKRIYHVENEYMKENAKLGGESLCDESSELSFEETASAGITEIVCLS